MRRSKGIGRQGRHDKNQGQNCKGKIAHENPPYSPVARTVPICVNFPIRYNPSLSSEFIDISALAARQSHPAKRRAAQAFAQFCRFHCHYWLSRRGQSGILSPPIHTPWKLLSSKSVPLTFRSYLRLLRGNRNFRRLWGAQVVSEIGDWFYTLAIYNLLLHLTGRAGSVALALVLQVLPQTFIGPTAGVVNDRLRRKQVMIAADIGRMVIVFCMLFVRSTRDGVAGLSAADGGDAAGCILSNRLAVR